MAPMLEATLLDRLERRASQQPEAPLLHYFDQSISFGELNLWADGFAGMLAGRGIGAGDRVAVSLQNNPQFLTVQFAVWKLGGILVPLSPMFKEREIEYHLQDSGAVAWVGLESLYEANARGALERCGVKDVFVTRETEVELPAAPLAEECRKRPGMEDVAYLVYTSGTTGKPKGARLLHRGAAYNSEVFRRWFELGAEDTVLGIAPSFHVTGLIAQIGTAVTAGVPLVLYHRFDAGETFRLAKKWKATTAVAAITAYIALLNHARENGMTRGEPFLTKCFSGGAPVAPGIVAQFEEELGTYIHNTYGLTESTSPSHSTPLHERAPVDPASGALSIGKPVYGCEAKVVDADDPSRDMADGEAGELVLRGPMIFDGYWNKPEETARAFHDGWFRTGDVAVRSPDGWYFLVDRKKDMIVASGYKVWPREVEDVLYLHPAVREAAVIGVPDAYRGETVKAFVSLKAGAAVSETELIDYCKERMAAYKYPRQVEFLEELPKTATGKFLRRELRRG